MYVTFDDGIHGREQISLVSLHRVTCWLNEKSGWTFDVVTKHAGTIPMNRLVFTEHFTNLIVYENSGGLQVLPVEDITLVEKSRASSEKG